MNRKSKAIATAFGSAAMAALVFAQVPTQDGDLFCSHTEQLAFDQSLPLSHPVNRCSSEATSVSWASWFTGRSNSSQFHYLDLLELLSRYSDSTDTAPHQP